MLLACLHPAPALAREWVLLGSRDVRLAGDADTIPVKAPKGQFRQIQLRVRGNGVFIHDLTVVYGNGAADDIPVETVTREEMIAAARRYMPSHRQAYVRLVLKGQ